MVSVVCLELPTVPPNATVTMPGIGELAFIQQKLADLPRPCDILFSALNSLAPAMAPIRSILRFLDVILSIQECLLAVIKAVATINPQPIVDCIQGLAEAIAFLLEFIPPFQYVVMITDIARLVRFIMDDMLQYLTSIDVAISNVKATLDRAQSTGSPALLQIGNCANEAVQAQLGPITQLLEAIGKSLGVINGIFEILASVLPPPASDKVKEIGDAITGAVDTAQNGIPGVTTFPPLEQIALAIVAMRNAAAFIEQVGSAITGAEFINPGFTFPTFNNPF